MNRRLVLQAATLAAALPFLALVQAQSSAAAKRHKIVIQVSDADPAKWNMALNNAKNLQDEVGAANVDIEIVAYGPGIGMLKADAATANRVGEATQSKVKLLACENTMRGQKLTREDMNTAISYVPAGVGQIMRRQEEGWSYLRP